MKLRKNEHVIAIFRRHWVIITFKSILLIIVFSIPIIGIFIGLQNFGANVPALLRAFSHTLASLWLLFFWIIIGIAYTDYYLDVWILTNQRIIDIDQKGLFHREVAELRVEHIQDITTNVSGIWANIFGFGNVVIQTAGTSPEFSIRDVASPEKVRGIVSLTQENNADAPHDVRIVS